MRTHFLAKHPTFGTKNNRKSLSYQQRSPYYWWWACLRRNTEYLKCCDKNGKTKMSGIYKDFGDVRGDDFKLWWDEHGVALFGERPSAIKLKELKEKDEWDDQWTNDEVMVVSIPLSHTKREITRNFGALLKKRHTAKRGRVATKNIKSTSAYPLSRSFSIASMRIALNIYDTYMSAKSSGEKMTLWQIGNKLRVVPSAVISPSDTPATLRDKQNALAATVKRYLNQAELAISNSVKGKFP